MINSLSLKNFKSINNNSPLDFKNLSIICGPNSSGKSSIIQAILMLSQTFSSKYLKKAVSLNGRLVRLGSFADILNHSSLDDEKHIEIVIEMQFSKRLTWMSIEKLKLNLTFASNTESNRKFEGEFHPEIIRGSVDLTTRETDDPKEQISFAFLDTAKSNTDLFSVLELESKNKASIAKDYPGYKIEGVSRQHLIPHILHLNYDHTKRLSQYLVPFLIGTPGYLKMINEEDQAGLADVEIPKSLLDKMRSLVAQENEEHTKNFVIPDEILTAIEQSKDRLDLEHVRMLLARQSIVLTPDLIRLPSGTGSVNAVVWRSFVNNLGEKEKKALFDFLIRNRELVQGSWYTSMKKFRSKTTYTLSILQDLNLFISYFLPGTIKYLGPLRNEPQAMYQAFDLSEPTMVGLKGENTAAVLHINKSTKIDYPLAVDKGQGKIDIIRKNDTLGVACTEWLAYLGVVTEFQTFDKGKLGYELQVKTTSNDRMQDLTHVGVGVSQILPIVVMALLSNKNDVLIFEQPELHLHPKVQSRLTDFFLAISGEDRQCLIETHSEYIINRLRLRIVQSRHENMKNKSTVLFIGKSKGESTFEKVDITSFGSIIDWPDGFFDQTDIEVENILLEAVAKKKEFSKEKSSRSKE